MPSGYVPGLPKPVGGGYSAPQWGTVEAVSTGGLWNVASSTLATPADNEFWVCASSQASNTYHYIYGTSQHTTQTGVGCIHAHNGTNGWTSGFIDVLKPRPNATWQTTVNHNKAGSYPSSSCVRFSHTEGFQIQPYQGLYGTQSSNLSTYTFTPRANKGPYPGGVCIAMATHEAGGAGIGGPDAGSLAAGWVGGTYGGALSSIAYYILSTTGIESAPSITFTSGRTSDCWVSCSVYIR